MAIQLVALCLALWIAGCTKIPPLPSAEDLAEAEVCYDETECENVGGLELVCCGPVVGICLTEVDCDSLLVQGEDPNPDAEPRPTVKLRAFPDTVYTGESTELIWTVSNATRCVASRDWSGERSPEAGTEKRFVYEDSIYQLTCDGPGGSAFDFAEVMTARSTPLLPPSISNPTIVGRKRA